jgi:hypothetical protein
MITFGEFVAANPEMYAEKCRHAPKLFLSHVWRLLLCVGFLYIARLSLFKYRPVILGKPPVIKPQRNNNASDLRANWRDR